jgi:HEAT repeat protein
MAVTMDQVRRQVSQDEPDYDQAAQLGAEALPHLMQIVAEGDPALASKATYLAAFIGAPGAADVITAAAQSPDAVIRIAAAGALTHVGEIPSSLVRNLLSDTEPGVRIWTLRALEVHRPTGFATQVQDISAVDADENVRQLAGRILTQLPDRT